MPVTIYGIKNCDTMKKACAWLDRKKVAYDFPTIRPLAFTNAGVDLDQLIV